MCGSLFVFPTPPKLPPGAELLAEELSAGGAKGVFAPEGVEEGVGRKNEDVWEEKLDGRSVM